MVGLGRCAPPTCRQRRELVPISDVPVLLGPSFRPTLTGLHGESALLLISDPGKKASDFVVL